MDSHNSYEKQQAHSDSHMHTIREIQSGGGGGKAETQSGAGVKGKNIRTKQQSTPLTMLTNGGFVLLRAVRPSSFAARFHAVVVQSCPKTALFAAKGSNLLPCCSHDAHIKTQTQHLLTRKAHTLVHFRTRTNQQPDSRRCQDTVWSLCDGHEHPDTEQNIAKHVDKSGVSCFRSMNVVVAPRKGLSRQQHVVCQPEAVCVM